MNVSHSFRMTTANSATMKAQRAILRGCGRTSRTAAADSLVRSSLIAETGGAILIDRVRKLRRPCLPLSRPQAEAQQQACFEAGQVARGRQIAGDQVDLGPCIAIGAREDWTCHSPRRQHNRDLRGKIAENGRDIRGHMARAHPFHDKADITETGQGALACARHRPSPI